MQCTTTPSTVCPKCKKDFLKPAWLARHNDRKTPCVAPGDAEVPGAERQSDGRYNCTTCKNTYANKFTVVRHIKKYHQEEHPQVCTLQSSINVSINVFGDEDTDHITPAEVLDILSRTRATPNMSAERMKTAGQNAIVQAAERIFGDINHPENITCFLPNKSDKTVMEHTKDGWQFSDIQRVAVPMTTAAMTLLTANQPIHDWTAARAEIDASQRLISYLSKNEDALCAAPPSGLATVLYSNKSRLAMILPRLPKFGEKMHPSAKTKTKKETKKERDSGVAAISYVVNILKSPIPDAGDEKAYKRFLRQCAVIIDPNSKRTMAEQFETAVEKMRASTEHLDDSTQKKFAAVCDWFEKNKFSMDWNKL